MSDPLPAYEGDAPFVFISYSHADDKAVMSEIAWLQSQGVRVWYDQGISTGTRWTDELAKHILAAETLLFFANRAPYWAAHYDHETAPFLPLMKKAVRSVGNYFEQASASAESTSSIERILENTRRHIDSLESVETPSVKPP